MKKAIFISSNSLHTIVISRIIHVTDWTPTLLSAVKDTLKEQQKVVVDQLLSTEWDGVDQWDTIRDNSKSKRTEFLYNIDPLFDKVANEPLGHGALRYVITYKIDLKYKTH